MQRAVSFRQFSTDSTVTGRCYFDEADGAYKLQVCDDFPSILRVFSVLFTRLPVVSVPHIPRTAARQTLNDQFIPRVRLCSRSDL